MRLNQNTKLKQAGFAYRVGLFAQETSHIKLPGLNQEDRMVKIKATHKSVCGLLVYRGTDTQTSQDTDVLENDTFALLFDAL